MRPYYISIKDELQYEKEGYTEELQIKDWHYLKEASERFLIHAYTHLFDPPEGDYEVFGDMDYKVRYGQFYLNLAIGLELLLKAILLKKNVNINQSRGGTKQFGLIINTHLGKILSKLGENTLEEIRHTLQLINKKRNNIAHCSKRSYQHFAYEYRFSYISLYIYDKYFYGQNPLLAGLLLKSIKRSKITTGSDFKPLRITPKSLS